MIPYDAELCEETKEVAVAMILAGLGKAELELVASYTTPLFWVLRNSSGLETMKNGSAFIIDTGQRVFGVTAAHVVTECLRDRDNPQYVQCMLGSSAPGNFAVAFKMNERVIDLHLDIDIATFWLSSEEIQKTGKTTLQGYTYPNWPPPLPQNERGILYCGFPGKGRQWLAPREICFGCAAMGGIASSVNETAISIQIERERMCQVLGDDEMPQNYDFGGMSGGPLLAIVQTPTIRSFMPAGVVIQGPNPNGIEGEAIPGLEIIKARPMHFILPDGSIDVTRWEQLNP
jgi:hypothetical protein